MSAMDSIPALLTCANGTYTVSFPELGIIVSDTDLVGAYQKAVSQRVKVVADFAAAGLEDRLPRGRPSRTKSADPVLVSLPQRPLSPISRSWR
jgi:hypothetical protein